MRKPQPTFKVYFAVDDSVTDVEPGVHIYREIPAWPRYN